jgi:hypothetical protein
VGKLLEGDCSLKRPFPIDSLSQPANACAARLSRVPVDQIDSSAIDLAECPGQTSQHSLQVSALSNQMVRHQAESPTQDLAGGKPSKGRRGGGGIT